MLMLVAMIFSQFAVQFATTRIKPFIVFAAIPCFGMVLALATLSIISAPFGFMAFLGVASLVGVIVSHIIVLFDFIDEARELVRTADLDAPERCRDRAAGARCAD